MSGWHGQAPCRVGEIALVHSENVMEIDDRLKYVALDGDTVIWQ